MSGASRSGTPGSGTAGSGTAVRGAAVRGAAGTGWLLAIDTATSRIVVAAGDRDGRLTRSSTAEAGHRHGEVLLPAIGELLRVGTLRIDDLVGIIVGTGPGAFTGLRVGLATAKTLAHARGVPIVGVGTATALARAAALDDDPSPVLVLLPAGPRDLVAVRFGEPPMILPGGGEGPAPTGDRVVAVDLDGRAPEAAVDLGRRALDALPAALLALGAGRLAAGDPDDAATLVPEYVTLPRGVRASGGEISWSHDRR